MKILGVRSRERTTASSGPSCGGMLYDCTRDHELKGGGFRCRGGS